MSTHLVFLGSGTGDGVVLDFRGEGCSTPAPMQVTNGTTTGPKDVRMEARLLREIVLPPEVAAEIDRLRALAGLASPAQERRFVENARLQYLYPGRAVVCVETAEGLAVVADAEPGAGRARDIKAHLPESVRDSARIVFPEGW